MKSIERSETPVGHQVLPQRYTVREMLSLKPFRNNAAMPQANIEEPGELDDSGVPTDCRPYQQAESGLHQDAIGRVVAAAERHRETIVRHLGIPPDALTLYFGIQYHLLLPEMIEFIETQGVNLVLFERARYDLSEINDSPDDAEGNGYWERLIQLGTGVTDWEADYNVCAFQELLKKGVTFASLDSRTYYGEPDNIQALWAILASPGIFSSIYLLTKVLYFFKVLAQAADADAIFDTMAGHIQGGMNRRSFLLKLAAFMMSAPSASLMAYTAQDRMPKHTLDRVPVVEEAIEAQVALNNALNLESIFLPRMEIIIGLRNHLMALNIWHMLARSATQQQSPDFKVFFGAAVGHGKIEDIFAKGPEYAETKIRGYAKEVIAALGKLLKATDADCDREKAQKKFVEICNLFAHPTQIGQRALDKGQSLAKHIPPSAEAVLFDVLFQELDRLLIQDKNKNMQRIDFLQESLMKLLINKREELANIYREEAEVLGTDREQAPPVLTKKKVERVYYFDFSQSQHLPEVLDDEDGESETKDSLVVGAACCMGQILPVVAQFRYIQYEDKIYLKFIVKPQFGRELVLERTALHRVPSGNREHKNRVEKTTKNRIISFSQPEASIVDLSEPSLENRSRFSRDEAVYAPLQGKTVFGIDAVVLT